MVVWFNVLLLLLWSVGAVYYLRYLPTPLNVLLAIAYCAGVVLLWRRCANKRKWLTMAAASVVVVYVLTVFQRPSHDRDWDDDHSRLPAVQISGDDVTVQNFRYCRYSSELEYDTQHSELTFELNRLSKVWFGVQRFTPLEGLAHTFLSFQIDRPDGPEYFCLSVEIRREKGEAFSPIKGFYRQYELIYVLADERDVIGVRTVHRPDDRVFLYPVNATAAEVQSLFRDIAGRVEAIRARPEFYNSFLNNCTNNIADHTSRLTPKPINPLDPRLVIPGYSDRLAFSKGLIGDADSDFDTVQETFRIDELARRAGLTEAFSNAIRGR